MGLWKIVFVVLMVLWLLWGGWAYNTPLALAGTLVPWGCVAILGYAVFGGRSRTDL